MMMMMVMIVGLDCNFDDDKIEQFSEVTNQKKIYTIILLKGYSLNTKYF